MTTDRKDVAGQVVAQLRDRIVSGAYPAGAFLPAERKLASEFGVARNTLRAALARLGEEGLVRRRGRHGTVVRDRSGSPAGGVVPLFLSRMPMSPEAMALLGGALCGGSRADLRFQLKERPTEGPDALIAYVRSHAVPGVLFLEWKDAETLAALREEGIPFVVINQELDIPGPATRVDFWSVGRKAAEHLIDLGHARIGIFSGPSERDMYDRMAAGFRGRAAESELYVAPSHMVRVASDSEAARAEGLRMFADPDRPTAVFCTRDVRAYGAYLAARELGLRVPEDLSLVGYDDITWPGESRAFLTTFPEPTDRLGSAAIEMLIHWIRTGEVPEDVVLKPELVVRGSTAECQR